MAGRDAEFPMSGAGPPAAGHVRGSRRQKMYSYWKAANEIRQTYQAQWQQRNQGDGEDQGIPGAFPDVEIVRSGDEEMVLFPSYARKHVKKHPATFQGTRDMPGSHEDIENPRSGGAEYWMREWERYEDDNAVVDIDVRGWIYSPHRGPLNRKNRLLVAVARRLSGIPGPATPADMATPGEVVVAQGQPSRRNASYEDEAAALEALSILQRGEAEAQAASRGGYSQEPAKEDESDSPPVSDTPTHQASKEGSLRASLTDADTTSEDETLINALEKRASWNQPANMTPDELKTANSHLMARLKPFMTIPLANTGITIFFFNDQKSRSRSIHTNDSGHFNVRASLDFVPTEIRVLASENLSATEKVIITESKGISLISDIDDTIKHSAISSGAREIFRNTFIRDLADLTIPGVKEWYNKMADMGVKMHYVSNSPWQLYPLLKSYFALAGLPRGSFHLKNYTGMLQGIFEPAAERKRGSLEKILHDFPDRKFILVGDSGEADLEVYSDIVSENPGRVLAVFIRDVTTSPKKKFFDQAAPNVALNSKAGPSNGSAASFRKVQSDVPEDRPALPARKKPPLHDQIGDLIDFTDEPETIQKTTPASHSEDLLTLQSQEPDSLRVPPGRPNKPSSLRGATLPDHRSSNHERLAKPATAPVSPASTREPSPSTFEGPISERGAQPPRPTAQSKPDPQTTSNPPLPPPPRSRTFRPHLPHRHTAQKHPLPPQPPPRPDFYAPDYGNQNDQTSRGAESDSEGYAAAARRQLITAYNALPSIRSPSPPLTSSTGGNDHPRPPPRKGLTSYPVAAARYAAGAVSSHLPAASNNPTTNADALTAAEALSGPNKKEDLWRRRWARAEELMRAHGVVLRSWRVGSDVSDLAVQVVERGKEDLERESGRRGGMSLMGS